ncbi:MAG: zinc-binding dehydrogenase [Chloroflexi bacterium]|nr:zinc-binding dehydrogenase [Chloroflexota bacterium]
MKAIRVYEFGGPEVMRYEDMPDPMAGPGEVLVRVHAAGVNFADHLTRRGAYRGEQPPLTPGLEAAGVVEAVGEGVSWPSVGDRVFGWIGHSYAQRAVTTPGRLLSIPEGLTFEQAAVVPVVSATAWMSLGELARVQPGERVLIHAAGSGVGMAAIQVAKALGAWVAVTAGSDWKLERAGKLGADLGLNYSQGDFSELLLAATDGKGVNVALEGVGRATFAGTMRSMAQLGRVVIYGSPSGARVELDTRIAIFRNLTLFGLAITTPARAEQTISSFKAGGLPMLTDGRLRPIIYRQIPLAEAAAAHELLLSRELFGKLVLVVD